MRGALTYFCHVFVRICKREPALDKDGSILFFLMVVTSPSNWIGLSTKKKLQKCSCRKKKEEEERKKQELEEAMCGCHGGTCLSLFLLAYSVSSFGFLWHSCSCTYRTGIVL